MVIMMIMGWHNQQQYYQHKHEHHQHRRQQHYQQQHQQLQQRQSGCGGIIINGLIFLTFINLQINTVMATITSSAKFYTIHWNSSNPIFRIDNTDNIIDVNRNNLKFDYDQVNLICPVYAPGTRDDEMEKYIIYNVSKDEYETCRITNPNPRIIAVCDKPYKLMYFTITFRPFTPQPGGLEFLPGHDYYFISTSTSDDLHRRIGGRCTSHNMKIVFKVWGESSSTSPSTTSSIQPSLSRWWSVTSPRITTIKTPIIVMTTIPITTTTITSSSSTITTTLLSTTKTTKKSKTYNKHPNEVVKSEELTLGGSGGGGNSSAIPNLIISCVTIIITITIYR